MHPVNATIMARKVRHFHLALSGSSAELISELVTRDLGQFLLGSSHSTSVQAISSASLTS